MKILLLTLEFASASPALESAPKRRTILGAQC